MAPIVTAPYLRDIDFAVKVANVDALYARILTSGFPVPTPLNEH